ncbi:MAG: hypothetical protein AAGF60_00620 [Pseudomonadota bacterium]
MADKKAEKAIKDLDKALVQKKKLSAELKKNIGDAAKMQSLLTKMQAEQQTIMKSLEAMKTATQQLKG